MNKKCSNCGKSIPEESSFCLHCFTIINKRTDETLVHTNRMNSKKIKLIILIAALIIFVCAFSLLLTLNNVTHNKSENDTIPVATKNSITEELKTTQTQTANALSVSATKSTTTTTVATTQTATKNTTEKTTQATSKNTTEKTSKTKNNTTKAATTTPQVIIDGGTLTNYPTDKKSGSYTIPYKVSKISKNAFNNNKYIKTLIFSKREVVKCDWDNLFSNLPNLKTVYVYPGTSPDLEGLQYFHGEIIYFD